MKDGKERKGDGVHDEDGSLLCLQTTHHLDYNDDDHEVESGSRNDLSEKQPIKKDSKEEIGDGPIVPPPPRPRALLEYLTEEELLQDYHFEAMFIEVKGPGDHLAYKQLFWLQLLSLSSIHQIHTLVCPVKEEKNHHHPSTNKTSFPIWKQNSKITATPARGKKRNEFYNRNKRTRSKQQIVLIFVSFIFSLFMIFANCISFLIYGNFLTNTLNETNKIRKWK